MTEVAEAVATEVATGGGLPTVTRAIQLAGGITSVADIRNIRSMTTKTGAEQTLNIDLWQLLHNGDESRHDCADGDTTHCCTLKNAP